MNACTSLCSAMRSARALSRPPFPTIIVRMRRCYVLGERTGVALLRRPPDAARPPPDSPPQAPAESAQQDPEDRIDDDQKRREAPQRHLRLGAGHRLGGQEAEA